MKIKTISRSEEAETRGTRREVLKVHKNTNPSLHPFEKAREVSTVPCSRIGLHLCICCHNGASLPTMLKSDHDRHPLSATSTAAVYSRSSGSEA